jgi:hypothetical protein
MRRFKTMPYYNKQKDLQRSDYSNESSDLSKINAAGIITIRLQKSWDSCRRSFTSGMFDALRDELMFLWTEFYADATPDQIKKVGEIKERIENNIKLKNVSRKSIKYWKYYSWCYKMAVYDLWLFMKTLEKGQGIGRAYIDKDADDWD